MKGMSHNTMQVLNKNDYLHHLRQINIFEEQYKTGIHKSYWNVFGICQKKKTNAVYNLVNMGFSI